MNSEVYIEIEIWDGPLMKRERVDNPSSAALHERLRSLDGERIDSLWIDFEGVGALTLGGGPDKFIAVSFPVDNTSSHAETSGPRPEQVELRVGGQTGLYPGAMILSADEAFTIAERFLLAGEYDPSFIWILDCEE